MIDLTKANIDKAINWEYILKEYSIPYINEYGEFYVRCPFHGDGISAVIKTASNNFQCFECEIDDLTPTEFMKRLDNGK